MVAKATTIPSLPQEGELIKGRKNKRGRKTPQARDLAPISEEQWSHAVGLLADGVPALTALKSGGITRHALEGALRTNDKMRGQWNDAKLAALRAGWDQDTIEEILVNLAMGATVKAACEMSLVGDRMHSFYSLILKDPLLREMYDDARMIQAEKMAIDDIIEIADNRENDETWDGKPNTAAVNRDRLGVDSRKWIAARLHHKRFGDRIQQDIKADIVVDHAARLEAARKRKARLINGDEDK